MRIRTLYSSYSVPQRIKLPILLIVSLTMALGRYDWSAASGVALRSWGLSAYFFCLIAGGIYAAARALSLDVRRYFWPALCGLAAMLNLPYRWLGLVRFFYSPHGSGLENPFVPEWIGRGASAIAWNSTDALLAGLLAATGFAWFATRRVGAHLAPKGRPILGFFLLLFAFMTVETWLHISNRSPYTYITHYEQPESAHYVYGSYMLPGSRGAVNNDAGYFLELEDLFQGNGPGPHMLLVRRSFTFYLSSHLSYFLGDYHSFLLLNLLFWLAAAAGMYFFVRDVTGSSLAASSAAGFVACGPGFIMYAAQPMAYLSGFAVLAIAAYLYHRLATATGLRSLAAMSAAGIVIGLTLLTYDNFAWILFFIGYARFVRAPLSRAFAAVLIGAAIYAGYLVLVFHVFKLPPADHANDRYMGDAARHALDLIRRPSGAKILPLVSGFFGNYLSQVIQVNFYVPAIVGVLGLFLASEDSRARTIALLLLLPSAAAFALLYFGESFLASYCRFNYASYPGIVLLAALAVDRSSKNLKNRGSPRLACLILALPFALCVLLANIDAFGFMPHLYFHFYFSSGGFFD